MTNPRQHWDHVYGAKSDTEVSWYQPRPERSLALIRAAARDRSTAIIDLGCGASTLISELAAEGYADLTALDASVVAVDKARARLGEAADRINWIVADVSRWQPQRHWDIWHDRAVLHFLTGVADQNAYIAALGQALRSGGTAIIATFALDGPEKCSGLPVQRYSGGTLARRLGPEFLLVSERPETHTTPRGALQRFMYAVLMRR